MRLVHNSRAARLALVGALCLSSPAHSLADTAAAPAAAIRDQPAWIRFTPSGTLYTNGTYMPPILIQCASEGGLVIGAGSGLAPRDAPAPYTATIESDNSKESLPYRPDVKGVLFTPPAAGTYTVMIQRTGTKEPVGDSQPVTARFTVVHDPESIALRVLTIKQWGRDTVLSGGPVEIAFRAAALDNGQPSAVTGKIVVQSPSGKTRSFTGFSAVYRTSEIGRHVVFMTADDAGSPHDDPPATEIRVFMAYRYEWRPGPGPVIRGVTIGKPAPAPVPPNVDNPSQ